MGLEDAGSAETNPDVTNNIIDLMADQENIENLGGTLRLGLYPCKEKGTKTAADTEMKMLSKNVTVIVMNLTTNTVNYLKKMA